MGCTSGDSPGKCLVKDISIKDLKNQLEEALKEKDDLKLKLENFEESLKNLTKLINSQISAKDKSHLRFKTGEGFHAVPPPYNGNYMPSRPDLSFAGLDDSVYKTKDTDSDNDSVFRPKSDQTKPKFTKINFVKSDENVKSVNKENTHRQVEYSEKSKSPKDNRRNWNGIMTQKLRNGFEFIKKACFVCGSFNHLIKDCDFHDKKMVEKPVLNNMGRVTGQREIRLVWNNAQRVNHQNKFTHPNPKKNFVPTAVVTKSGQVPVNTAKQTSPRAATSINTTMLVNTASLNQKFTNVTTAGPKAVVNAAEGNRDNADQGIFDSGGEAELGIGERWVNKCASGGRYSAEIGRQSYKQNNMSSFDLKNVVPLGGLTCLFTKATIDESNLWHRRLGHINFNTMNKLVRGNLVRGLPSKLFENDHTCVACQKGKQHKASCKTKTVSSISKPLQLLHMDLFGLVSDETPEILKNFIIGIENQIDHKVKTIRCDNGTEFKNRIMNEFCEIKRIRREFSVARTPQQNGVAERKNRTLIEAARTMLADSKLPTTFWAKAVNTACYVQNMVLVIKPHNKTPYELFLGRKPALSFMRPFGCPVTILNTLDHLGKFDGKSDDGFFVGYSINSKAFRVFNTRTRFVEENLHINFLENKPNVAGTGPNWMFDIDTLTMSMNYQPVFAGNQTNGNAGTKANIDAGQARKKTVPGPQYVLLPFLTSDSQGPKSSNDKVADDAGKQNEAQDPAKEGQEKDKESYANNTNRDCTVSPSVSTARQNFTNTNDLSTDPLIPDLEDTGIFSGAYDDEDVGAEVDLNNLEITMNVSPIPTTRIHKDHPKDHIIGDINSATQTRRMTKISEEHAMVSYIKKQRRTNHKDYQNYLVACFILQIEPNKVTQALQDPIWIEAMQDELL
ncbi:putative ribonuclease H-like domain-containing protein [Tanacetum coccineum]